MSTPPNPYAMPMNELAQAAGVAPAAPATPAPSAPTTAPPPAPAPAATPAPAAPVAPPAPAAPVVPEPFSVNQDDTGITIQMSPEFGGEVFKGKDWAEVGPKIAKAKADANAYIKTLKAQPPTQQPPATPPEPVDPAVQATREWLLAETAAALGMSVDEYKQRVGMVFNTTEQMAQNIAFTEFHRLCPSYVDTPENSAVIAGYFADDYSPGDAQTFANDLKTAYALAVLDGKIKPQAAASPVPVAHPPVMPSTSATSSTTSAGDPWSMPLDQLGQLAGITK